MPKTLDELLIVVPGLRKRRSLNAELLRLLLDRAPKECTWCGGKVGKGRSTWCGDACVVAFKARCCSTTQRQLVVDRDGGECRICGRDTIAAEAEAKAKCLTNWPSQWHCRPGESITECRERMDAEMLNLGYARGVWREVDHEVPVVLGGGLCTIEQLRLLCGACHAEVTRRLAAARKVR